MIRITQICMLKKLTSSCNSFLKINDFDLNDANVRFKTIFNFSITHFKKLLSFSENFLEESGRNMKLTTHTPSICLHDVHKEQVYSCVFLYKSNKKQNKCTSTIDRGITKPYERSRSVLARDIPGIAVKKR